MSKTQKGVSRKKIPKPTSAAVARRPRLTAKQQAHYKERMERALAAASAPPADATPPDGTQAFTRPRRTDPDITPEERERISHLQNVAYYGADAAGSPLFWTLERLHANDDETFRCFREKRIRAFVEAEDYVTELTERWKRDREADALATNLEQIPPSLFFDWAAIAIRNLDAKFFEATALLLRSVEPESTDVVVRHALSAYQELKQILTSPTKKDVREKTMQKWAMSNAIRKRGIPWDGAMPSDREIRHELSRLPAQTWTAQNWTTIWERAQLQHLPSDRGGRPRKMKR